MSHFEYISVAGSLILALGVTRLVGGLTYAVQGEHRYWVHGLWCLVAVVNQATSWWNFWNYRLVDEWTLGALLLVLLYPVLTYVGASILMPAEASRATRTGASSSSMLEWDFSLSWLSSKSLSE